MAPTETEVPQSILKIGETTANKISQNIDYKKIRERAANN